MGKILIVDDDPEYADMMARQMRALEHEVVSCHTLEQGLRKLASFEPAVVLLDVMLPDGNGLDGIRAIKAAPCMPEVIIITGSGDEDGAELAVRSGAWDYWQKGRSAKGIVLPLKRAMEYRDERLARRGGRPLDLEGMVGGSQAMTACFELIREASSSDTPVLVHGETGTGKEVVARAIHKNSARAKKPFIVVDCASLTETLMESALFGHDKGAFTGASAERAGLVRQAHEGTLFLDEIGELPLSAQKAFLRVLQEKRFRPVGSDREIGSDFRLVAATNRDLAQMVKAGSFREDLFFRVQSLEIVLPPLRAREHDSVKIAKSLLIRISEKQKQEPKSMSGEFADALEKYPWPGNVRELCQAVECAVASAGDSPTLEPIHLPVQLRVRLVRSSVKPELNLQRPQSPYAGYPTLSAARDSAVAAYLVRLVEDTHGDMDAACELADLSRSRLYELLKLHGIGRSVANVP
jgi:two-component system, NtrC family, response regulator